uniref:Uncharacterized protein n=1 Tax=Lotus japonicus TaxID=34305 RepID=I3T5Z0_LOTJA|nr:unknown [Lotus japonicus]
MFQIYLPPNPSSSQSYTNQLCSQLHPHFPPPRRKGNPRTQQFFSSKIQDLLSCPHISKTKLCLVSPCSHSNNPTCDSKRGQTQPPHYKTCQKPPQSSIWVRKVV